MVVVVVREGWRVVPGEVGNVRHIVVIGVEALDVDLGNFSGAPCGELSNSELTAGAKRQKAAPYCMSLIIMFLELE